MRTDFMVLVINRGHKCNPCSALCIYTGGLQAHEVELGHRNCFAPAFDDGTVRILPFAWLDILFRSSPTESITHDYLAALMDSLFPSSQFVPAHSVV